MSIAKTIGVIVFGIAIGFFGSSLMFGGPRAEASESPSLYTLCHNTIDDDNDGYIDLLDSQCAEFRPVCDAGYHSDESFICVPDEETDPVCVLPQVLVEHVCVDPEPLECESPQVPNEAQTQCVDPVIEDPVCTENQHLEDHQCVANPSATDACSNIDGMQNGVPENMHLDGGLCVANATTNNGGGGGGGSGGGNGPIFGSLMGSNTNSGNNGPFYDLGGPLSCSALFKNYLKAGMSGPQVWVLQVYLSMNLGVALPLTGVYDATTVQAVKVFQTKYASEILSPWNLTQPTGIFYITSLHKANVLHCGMINPPLPPLTPWVE